ncbi:unnamed protein product [Gordionus sp. m RMFG-2023]
MKSYATEGTPYHSTRPPSPYKNDPMILMKENQYYFTQQNTYDDEKLKAYYVDDTPTSIYYPISSNNFVNDIKYNNYGILEITNNLRLFPEKLFFKFFH